MAGQRSLNQRDAIAGTHELPDFSLNGPTILLSDVATLLRAPLLKDEGGREGEVYKVLSITDIPEYGDTAYPHRQVRLRVGKAKADKYQLAPNDVLVSIVGTIGRLCMVPAEIDGKWIPTSNLVVVRFKEHQELWARYFLVFMRSVHGKTILDRLTHGDRIPMISKKEFSKIEIPDLSDEVRNQVNEVYRREQELVSQIDESINAILQVRRSFLDRQHP